MPATPGMHEVVDQATPPGPEHHQYGPSSSHANADVTSSCPALRAPIIHENMQQRAAARYEYQ